MSALDFRNCPGRWSCPPEPPQTDWGARCAFKDLSKAGCSTAFEPICVSFISRMMPFLRENPYLMIGQI